MKDTPITGRGRIFVGVVVGQDFRFGKWPLPGVADPNMVFDVVWDGHHWKCKADGYGYLRSRGEGGEYGCGCIHVSSFDGVKLAEEERY